MEVESWEIHLVANNKKRKAIATANSILSTVVKKGFETVFSINRFVGQGYTVTLGKDGNELGQTVVAAPYFVPKAHGSKPPIYNIAYYSKALLIA